jgi:hypothetical protein
MKRHVCAIFGSACRVRHTASRLSRLACAAWLVTGVARADKMTDAEELFRRAKGLMAENKPREACPLLEESERLDPQMGTLLNLAICHESVGKIASAWGEFRAVEQQARAANRDDRVKLARERAAKLEPRLPRIRVVAPSEVKTPGLMVKVGGELKGEPLWTGVAVDPGTWTVEASAPGKKTATLKVKVDDEGTLVTVTLPKLEDAPVVDPKVNAEDLAREQQYAANRSRKTTGIVVGGAGAATIAVGGVFGVLAIIGDSDATQTCPKPCFEGSTAARSADDKTDRALLFANVANVLLPIGLVAAAIGGYMLFSAGPTEKPRALISPQLGGNGLGVRW